jgi:hypothetical protein
MGQVARVPVLQNDNYRPTAVFDIQRYAGQRHLSRFHAKASHIASESRNRRAPSFMLPVKAIKEAFPVLKWNFSRTHTVT